AAGRQASRDSRHPWMRLTGPGPMGQHDCRGVGRGRVVRRNHVCCLSFTEPACAGKPASVGKHAEPVELVELAELRLNVDINICRFIDMEEASSLLRLLGDETRLRLLRVLSREALNVSELTAILGVAQSGVSRHLGLLREAGLVVEQRGGTFTW